jgi:tankyrase
VRALLARKAGVNQGDSDGMTPLHVAASRAHAESLVALLEGGAAVDAASRTLRATPLHCAARAGDLRSVEVLLRFAQGRRGA